VIPHFDEVEVIDIPGNHISVFNKENIDAIAAAFRGALERAMTPAKTS
jgi:thioesterase domain-containing protein